MNIFEALEKGEGRATLPNVSKSKFAIKKLVWIIDIYVNKGNSWDIILEEDLKRNDWIPYVPREACSNCGQAITTKVKHREVFENVKWYRTQWNIIYPAPIAINQEDSNKKLLNKPPMKMTVEWEE